MKAKIPPCPDPASYVLVHSTDGYYWRRKRGTIKPAQLNPTFKANAQYVKVVSPAASRMAQLLQPFTERMETGRMVQRFIGSLVKALHADGNAHYRNFTGMELQPHHPLRALLLSNYTTNQENDMLNVSIPIDAYCIYRFNTLVTACCFELVLLTGRPDTIEQLRIDGTVPVYYTLPCEMQSHCLLSMQVPTDKPWIALLRVSCREGNEWTYNYKGYGMRVVAVG
ncbi:MAG: hypothetical protein JST86_00205 [Bacteroidetes bacterium]|nr:hypothetical protein [Bacteroidota bacterium]